MGRSVSYPSGAIVAFTTYEEDEEEERAAFYAQEDWEDYVIGLEAHAMTLFPSLRPCDKWIGREDHAVAENDFAYFGLSSYGDLVSVWIAPKDLWNNHWEDRSLEPLQRHWLGQIEPRFLKAFGTLRKLGTFSNGEGVFERATA